MKRAAILKLEPTYDAIEEGRDAYLHPLHLRPLAKRYGRYWSFHSVPTTVALPNNRYAKSLKGFTSHTDEPSFRELLREYSDHGIQRPSGYADVFHSLFSSPRVPWSINANLAPAFAGGWQAALNFGAHRGLWRRYDMRSAYMWAATLGLPDTQTYTRSLDPERSNGMGIYRVRLARPAVGAPFPFNMAQECLASSEEIRAYGLDVSRVIVGVRWTRQLDGGPVLNALRTTTTWKEAGRCFWGRWAQAAKVECNVDRVDGDGVVHAKRWKLPNLLLNIPWAHMIVSRVKMKLWEQSQGAVHVFVDSVITQREIRTGESLGDWRLEKVYPHGVIIRGPGQYGGLNEAMLDKNAGHSVRVA